MTLLMMFIDTGKRSTVNPLEVQPITLGNLITYLSDG